MAFSFSGTLLGNELKEQTEEKHGLQKCEDSWPN